MDNLSPLNWKRAKAVEATAAKLEPEALEILPLLCQSGQQGQALAMYYAINDVTRTAERIVRRKVIARDCDYERNSMYEEGRGAQECRRDDIDMEDEVVDGMI